MKAYAFQVPKLLEPRRIEPGLWEGPVPGVSPVAKLEGCVSILQITGASLKHMRSELSEMEAFLKTSLENRTNVPGSLTNSYLVERLRQIKALSESASFQGRALLNGKSGVLANMTGEGLRFVRGSALVQSSNAGGYPVAIERAAKPASLVGPELVNTQTLSAESMLVIAQGQQEVRYRLSQTEDPKSLVAGLQRALWQAGLELSACLSVDGRLVLMHNRLGSGGNFKGMSLNTRILSNEPGEFSQADPGEDIKGRIGMEKALGDGGFLIGVPDSKRVAGLVLHYGGKIEHPGQIVGYADVAQKGILVPLDANDERKERLSIPAVNPKTLSVGVANQSGFTALEEIKGSSEIERMDSLKLVKNAQQELVDLSEELKWKENTYVDLAIKLLRQGIAPQEAGEELLELRADKATKMAQDLKNMLGSDFHNIGQDRLA
ncbi:MAG: hypothetical protein QNL04_14045 [SAR324 cluster bacterium]|nr:hypothetical protein [SAR324 cluster bacterium]